MKLRRRMLSELWEGVMHADHGWFARHQYTTLAIIFACVLIGPGAIQCLS